MESRTRDLTHLHTADLLLAAESSFSKINSDTHKKDIIYLSGIFDKRDYISPIERHRLEMIVNKYDIEV